jgi:anaphase-promoting complex subunit 2
LDQGSFLSSVLSDVLQKDLTTQVQQTILNEFDRDDFHFTLIAWKDDMLHPWVCDLVGPMSQGPWCEWLQTLVAESIVKCRMTQLFDILRDYPDSLPAVEELSVLLRKTQLHAKLLESLIKSLSQRLLHPGASTSQIIDIYINAIKCLRLIDPSDRLLQQVAEPVRSYLRGRSDTVRCIITNLTDQNAELFQELRNHGPLEDTNEDEDEDDEDEPPGMDWIPPPPLTEQRITFFEGRSRNLDILSILVSIYGSKELFVDEYRIMLADKLLSNLDYNTDAQVHTLELLKLRFGDGSMRQCEIMIKDTDDSKRIVSNIHSTLQTRGEKSIVDAAIISHIFWPSILQQEPMRHHPRIQAELDVFCAEYAQLKNPRRLVWYNQLGRVDLDLEVWENGMLKTKQISCLPLMATLITYFEDKPVWTAEELSNVVGIPETLVKKRMQFWQNHRVVVLSGNSYHLASTRQWAEEYLEDEEDFESTLAIGGNEEAEQDDVLTSYVIGMLKRYKELPLGRIHEMLKLFANGSDHKYNKTPRQLTSLLQKLCRDEKLECGPTGLYKILEK